MASPVPIAAMIGMAGLPPPAFEFKFHPKRRWRFDFAWPKIMLALEIEGGTYSGGRHVRGNGYERDCEKYNTATLLGWRILRVTTGMVKSGKALALLEEAFRALGN